MVQFGEKLTRACAVMIRRHTATVREFCITLRQLQNTQTEETLLAFYDDLLYYFERVIANGSYHNVCAHSSYMSSLDMAYNTVIPQIRESLFPNYFHPNGSMRQSWRAVAVNGVIPYSKRSDISVDNERAMVSARNEDPVTQIYS